MNMAASQNLTNKDQKFQHLHTVLRTLGPESSLQRGYSITFDANGNVLRSREGIGKGERLTTRLADGEILSVVE